MIEPLERVEDVADKLGVSKATVYRMVHRGELQGVRMGRSVRVFPESVRKMMESNRIAE